MQIIWLTNLENEPIVLLNYIAELSFGREEKKMILAWNKETYAATKIQQTAIAPVDIK